MTFSENSTFYKKGKEMLDDYVARGGKVENLSANDKEYKYIKNNRVKDENGNLIDLETKFNLLGHPRNNKYSKNLREDLLKEINEFLANGGSLHINRKKLPFYERLNTYSTFLKRKSIILTHEQIMRDDLGFKSFSDIYYRCKEIFKLKNYRDEDGYVDDYHKSELMSSYISTLAISLKIPYYLLITLIADEKLRFYDVSLDKVKYTEVFLKNYAKKNETFVGMKRNNKKVYNALDYLTRYYSDGTPQRYSKSDWLDIFDLGDVEHKFKESKQFDINIDEIMARLKNQYKDQPIRIKDLDHNEYRLIIKKSISLSVNVSQIFEMYGLKCNGIQSSRLSQVRLNEVPYLEEMKKKREEIIKERGITLKVGYSKEQVFEEKVKAVQQVFAEYKEKLETYVPEEIDLEAEVNIDF